MADPTILYDNRFSDAVPVASSTEAGFDVLNLRDWRPYTQWKPTAMTARVTVDVAASGLAWEFTNSQDGWTVTDITPTLNPTTITLTATTSDPRFTSPVLTAFDGGLHRYVVARLKRLAGSTWDGRCTYVTPAHALTGGFSKTISDPTGGTPGGFVLGIWDMHDLTSGGDDWKESIITQIRLDFGAASGDNFEVDWIIVAKNPYADYALLWGHDLGTVDTPFAVRGSHDNFATDDLVKFTEPANDDPVAVHFTSVAYRYWRMSFTGSTVPTIAIAAIGSKLDIPSTIREGFDPTKRDPKGIQNRSVTGNPLGSAVTFEEWRETVTFELLAWSWIRSTWIPAWEAHLRGTPFVFQWDRTGHAAELFLVSREGGFDTPHKAGSFTDLSFNLVGLA